MADPAVPFTNNKEEWVLRIAKLQMKISGCFRTRAGTEGFALMRGLVETARQREWHHLDLLQRGPDAMRPPPVPH